MKPGILRYDVHHINILGRMDKVTPEEAQKIIDCSPGKCGFVLLPEGELRLRVWVSSHEGYQFFPLNNDFVAIARTDL